jgi:hypothetical protein
VSGPPDDARQPISFVDHLDPPDQPWSPPSESPRRYRPTEEMREQLARERKLQRAMEDDRTRAWIEAGNETRQPPEYRGRVFDHADSDGVHPTAFPPLRWGPQDSLSEEFVAFQAYNGTTVETHPHYYCVTCRIRYNARDGGRCGPCIGREQTQAARSTPLFEDVPLQPRLPDYPD